MSQIAKLLVLSAVCILSGSLIIAHYRIECLQKDLLACYVKVNDTERSIEALNRSVLAIGEVVATYKYIRALELPTNYYVPGGQVYLTNLTIPLNK